jgi:RNA polymerase sigma-70 factor, ECF subfamily
MPTLLQQIAAGDTSAVGRCLDAYGGMIWTIAMRYLGTSRSEVEDAVQEAFLSIWLSAANYDPARGSEPAFVVTIARRRIIDYRRRLEHVPALAGDLPSMEQAQDTRMSADERVRLGHVFAALPDDERTALWLSICRGLSHSQIAAATQSPIGTVKTRLRRAVMRLQQTMPFPNASLSMSDAPASRQGGAS